MDPVLLARIQFALTVGFHFLWPPLTIGMSWIIVWIMWRYLRTGEEIYRTMSRFWVRIFALTFAVGVATGIVMEFQFGTNWAAYSRFVGDIFGPPLAAEGVFAFFLESTFIGLLIFGERRLSKRMHFFSALMVALGATMSAFWIIVANSWQQTPTGYEIEGSRAVLTDFWAATFNPSTMPRYVHTVVASLITGSFFMLGISAWYLLKGRHLEFAKRTFRISLVAAFAATVVQAGTGHWHAVQVAHTQPLKLAAFESLFETTDNAPLVIFGYPNVETGRTEYALKIPGLLSLLVGNSFDTEVQGLNDFDREDWPPIHLTGFSFHVMFLVGVAFIGFTGLGMLLLWRRKLFDLESPWIRRFMKFTIFMAPWPLIINELGWIAAEVGRQPWTVYGELRTEDSVSVTVPAEHVLASIIMFVVIYTLLFGLWFFLLRRKLEHGPQPLEAASEDREVSA